VKHRILWALAAAVLAGNVSAQNLASKGDPAKGKLIVQQVCAACHGIDGNSVASANPSLAGQHPAYIVAQLKAFKSGARQNPVMLGMASTLSPADMLNVAAYFGTQKAKDHEAADKTQLELGRKLYRGGNPVTHVPACMACHGPNGAGIPDQFPRLGGQQSAYVLKQLTDMKAGTVRKNQTMMDIANRLSDAEMKAVAEYISGLR
jgi:cytochrome c553